MSEVIIELANDAGAALEIHRILCDAFEPYRSFYTPAAFADTVRTAEVFEQRIISPEVDVLVALLGREIVGTASAKLTGDELYFFSMGVKPDCSGKGVGRLLLEKIEGIAREKNCATVSLETCRFLTKAIALYERFGFARTGRERDYSGNTVFEMKKDLTEVEK